MAYSLLGLFSIHIQLINDEGYKAFMRLQEATAQVRPIMPFDVAAYAQESRH